MKPTFTRLARLFVFVLFHCSLVLSAQIGSGIAPVSSPSGGFNIDGTLSSTSAIGDWVSGTGSGGFVLANSGTPLNTKTTYHLYDEYNSGTDNIFGGGDKVSDNPNNMSWVLGTANNKTDMNNALIHFTTDTSGNVWFVFAADRLSNSGNAYIDFEFLQDELTKTATGFATTGSSATGGRMQGDFLLTVYFENGVAKFDIQHWENVGGIWQYKTYFASLPLNSVYAAGNSTAVPVPYSAFGTNSYPQNTFIESAVNLTEVLSAIDPCASLKIKTIFVKSKTSTAPSASIKDFFEPLAVTNLTLGSADAGDDDTVCSGGNYKLQGVAVPSSNYSVVSTTWTVLSGNATIANPSQLDSYVTINGSSATLRLTVETHPSNGIGTHCIVYDDVTITTIPYPSCSITGANGPLCPSATGNNYSAPISASYLWSISGNGTISGSATSQTVNVSAGQNCNESFTLTLDTTDANGCTSNCTKIVTVNDSTSPVITTPIGTLNHTLQCDNASGIASALAEVPTATDNCSTTPTIHIVSDVTTPATDCANGYSRVRTWNFTDGCGNTSDNFVQTIIVIDTTAPVVSTTSGTLNHTLQCDNASGIASALAEIPTATDNCSITPTLHLVSDITTPDTNCANAYSRVRTWNFTDGCGNTSADFVQTITIIDDVAPVVTTISGTLNHTLQCDNASAIASALTELPTATDNCSATPTLHLVSDVTTPASGCANGYSRVRTWNFTDGCGNTSDNFVQTITVIDTTAPVVSTTTGTLDHTIQCSNTTAINSALTEIPTATDNCSSTPTLHLVSDITTPDANCANAYSRVRTWNFTDGCGNTSADFVQTITVIDNVAPVVTTISGTLNHTLQCDNASAIASALTELPTATDNCSATTTLHLVSDVTTPASGCANGYSRVRTWNFTDGCGNTSAEFVQTITVIDTTAPVVSTTTGTLDHTIQCSNTTAINSALTEIPTATDNCSSTPTLHLVSDITTPDANCANAYSRVRTWNFSDGCGNTSADFVQTITVIDTTAPVFVEGTPNDITVECDAIPLAAILTATDNCGESTVAFVESQIAGSCIGSYTINRKWTASDSCGNQNSHTQIITVKDTTAPTFIAPVDITLNSDSNCYVDISTTSTGGVTNINDNCDPHPIASYEDYDCFGNFNSASLNSGNGNYFPFTISGFDTITANNIKKVALAFETNQGKGRAEFVLVAPNGQGIVMVAPYCKGGDCDSSTPSEKELYLPVFYPNSSNYPKWDNRNPITPNSIQNFTPNGALTTTNTIIGLNSIVSSFEEFTGDLNGNWFIFARKDGTEEGRIDFKSVCLTPSTNLCGNNTVIVRKWSVSDACSNTVAFNQIIKIVDTTVPTWITETGSLDTTVECNDAQALANAQNAFPIVNDNCDTNLSNIVKIAGEFVASSTCSNAGTYTNTWTVADDCGNISDTFTQVITVQDSESPKITTQATDIIVECDGQGNQNAITNWLATNGGAIATDNCSEIIWTNNFNSMVNDCSSAVTVVFTATDTCGNSTSTSATFSIQDTTAPVVPEAPASITVGCTSDIPAMISLTAIDNCSGNITVEGINTIELGNCDATYTINRTWAFRDACNNVSTVNQTINVIDTTAPVIAQLPEPTTIACSNTPIFTQATATDECGSVLSLTFNDVKTVGNCAGSYAVTRTWTATDSCGNSSNASQTITIEDTTAPVFANLPQPTTINCSDTPVFAFATATDECGSDFSLTFKDARTEGNCAGSYSITRTWRATDDCGNSTTASQTITVEDTTGPTTTTVFSTDIAANCDTIPAKPELVFVDACSTVLPASFSETISNQTSDSYVINRKWMVADSCGNASEFVQTVKVTITNSLTELTGTVCNDGETTNIDLTSLFPIGTPTNGTWTDVSNTGKLESSTFNAASLSIGDYIFEYTINDPDCPRTIRITISVNSGCGGIVLPCGTIVVHNTFSPNGDGINDKFVIDNINDTNCYPDNTVEIYNRWGVLVYSTKGYNNTTNAFDGISNGRSIINQSSGLPAGTYFYILTYTSFDNNNNIQTNKKEGYLFLTK